MLQNLFIQNYTLIEKLDLNFSKGFSVLTGETGAGKSIIIGALGLVLGNRADRTALKKQDQKCIVEATFDIKNYNLKYFFDNNDLDYDTTLILRREINIKGKSRAFINDTPVNLSILKNIGDKLVNIHSQHETLMLNNPRFQLDVLDNYAKNKELLQAYESEFIEYKQIALELEKLKTKQAEAKKDFEYYQFQYEELEKANLTEGEYEESEKELEVLNNAEEIKETLNRLSLFINEDEIDITGTLTSIKNQLEKVSSSHQALKELSGRIQSIVIELNDIGSEAENISDDISYSPAKIEELTNRLDIINHLFQKHMVSSVHELIKIKHGLYSKINTIETTGQDIEETGQKLEKKEKTLQELAKQLSGKRKKNISNIEKEVSSILSKLGMQNAIFTIYMNSLPKLTSSGKDEIRFLFSANKGMEAKEISKIASGGELSRLMLSIKSLIPSKKLLPTIIFDEIDIGVSGEIAGKVGKILLQMSNNMQVIAITHLPQIAGMAQNHFLVYKEPSNGSTRSNIKKISGKERENEIAKILSGGKVTEAAVKTARELLKTS